MENLEKAQQLLSSYNINNDKLACDIAIMILEAEQALLKEQLK